MKHDDFNIDKMTARYEDAERMEDGIDHWQIIHARTAEYRGWYKGLRFEVEHNLDTNDFEITGGDMEDYQDIDSFFEWLEGEI